VEHANLTDGVFYFIKNCFSDGWVGEVTVKEQISLLAKGQQMERPLQLSVIPETVCIQLAAGQNYRGELDLQETGGRMMKGLLYSSHRRVRLLTQQFAGEYVVAEYEVETAELVPGDRIRGAFHLVTNAGERTIPYDFEMTVPVGKTAYDKIKTIEAFADLARQDFDVALTIFENSSFLSLPFMKQPAFAALYHGLYGRGDRRGTLEEFLTGCGAKEQLRLTVDEKPRFSVGPREDVCDSIRIQRNTWGAVNARVKADAPFIELEKKTVTEDAFEGNEAELRYILHPSMLHAGTNYGRITITTAYQKFQLEITVTQTEGAILRRKQRERREAFLHFYKNYVEAHARNFENPLLTNSMLTELARLRENYDVPDLFELFHAEVYLRAGQKEKAGLLLADVKNRILDRRREEIDTYCYYYYLRTLHSESEEDRDQLRKILRFYYEGEHPSQTVYFLLLLTDDYRQENPLMTLGEMRDLYAKGCRSPFLYLAACRLIERQPLLLTRLGDFELRALLFGAKRKLISEDIAGRIAKLSEEERSFRGIYYRLLVQLYDQYPDVDELVAAVCRILIQGEKKGTEYFKWYQQGVAQDVRLTRLYEYFLYSLPGDWEGEMPQEIYLYFSYTNTLDELSKAVLFDNVLSCFAPGSQIYDSFARQMEEFAREQVFSGRMNRRLARIYEKMIPAGMLDEKLAAKMARLLYCVQISSDDPAWDQVILSYEEWGREESAILKDGKAVVALYSDRCRILFQDVYGNRYAGGNYSQLRLMEGEELLERCQELCPEDPYILLHRCCQALDQNARDGKALALYEKTLGLSGLRPLFCCKLTSQIVEGTLAGPKSLMESVKESLAGEPQAVGITAESGSARLLRVDTRFASREDALRMLEAFIEDDYCDKAFAMLERYGYESIKPSLLLKLCSCACVEQLFAKNTLLLQACFFCLEHRRSDEVILEYLCRHFNGSSEQMLQILLKAGQYHGELHDMPERLLCQMLFTGWREGIDEVFEAYRQGGVMDESLLRAYLMQKCYDFFVKDVAAEAQIFTRLEQMCVEERLPFIGRIALCRYLAYMPERTADQNALCVEIVRDCSERNLYFDFFGVFSGEPGYPAGLQGRTIVSHRAPAGEVVRIRYRVLPDDRDYTWEILPHMYESYHSKCFTVFYGEQIHYEIYREGAEGLYMTGEGTILPSGQMSNDRLGRLNHLLYGMDTMDDASLKKEMRAYGVAEVVLDHYFEKL